MSEILNIIKEYCLIALDFVSKISSADWLKLAFIPLIVYLFKLWKDRNKTKPHLHVSMVTTSSETNAPSISMSDFNPETIDLLTKVEMYYVRWGYNIIITNNSENTINVPLIYNRGTFTSIENIDVPNIAPNTSIFVNAYIQRDFEDSADKIKNKSLSLFPRDLKELKFVIYYTNRKNKKFYALCSYRVPEAKLIYEVKYSKKPPIL